MYFIVQKSKKLKNYNNENSKSIFFFFRKSLFLLFKIRYVREIFTKLSIVFEIKNYLYGKNRLECNHMSAILLRPL